MGQFKLFWVGQFEPFLTDHFPLFSRGHFYRFFHPDEWIIKTLDYCNEFDNQYLFQSKNPGRIIKFIHHPVFTRSVVCTTIESNRLYPEITGDGKTPKARAEAMGYLSEIVKTYVTIEPIMKFDMAAMVRLIRMCNPVQANIGADSGNNRLHEPTMDEVLELIFELQNFTTANLKTNLNRLLA